MKNDENNNTTLDDLAGMMARGFDDVGEKIERGLGEVKKDIGHLKLAVDDLDKKVEKLDYKVEEVRDLVVGLDEGPVLDLQQRVQVLEKTSHNHP